jgi:hypothetical protein
MCENDSSCHKESQNSRTTTTHSHHAHHHTNQQSTATHAPVFPPSLFALLPPLSIAVNAATIPRCHSPMFMAGFITVAVGMGRCHAHGNNFCGYRGLVQKIWYLKITKVHIQIHLGF